MDKAELRLLKLVSGEEVIAVLVSVEEDGIWVVAPRKFSGEHPDINWMQPWINGIKSTLVFVEFRRIIMQFSREQIRRESVNQYWAVAVEDDIQEIAAAIG